MEEGHVHNCPLCDKEYVCSNYGCEEQTSMVCSDCYLPEDEGVEAEA